MLHRAGICYTSVYYLHSVTCCNLYASEFSIYIASCLVLHVTFLVGVSYDRPTVAEFNRYITPLVAL